MSQGAVLRIRAKATQVADPLAVNYLKANISARQMVLLDLAMKVSLDAERVTEDDFEVLQAHGFDNEDIGDIRAITPFFA